MDPIAWLWLVRQLGQTLPSLKVMLKKFATSFAGKTEQLYYFVIIAMHRYFNTTAITTTHSDEIQKSK